MGIFHSYVSLPEGSDCLGAKTIGELSWMSSLCSCDTLGESSVDKGQERGNLDDSWAAQHGAWGTS